MASADPARRIQFRRPTVTDAGYAAAWSHVDVPRRQFFAPVAQVVQRKGVGIDVYLCSEQGVPLSEPSDVSSLPFAVLPTVDDVSCPLLRFIDPYCDTMFNHRQAAELRLELLNRAHLVTSEHDRRSVEFIAALAERCAAVSHSYLWFIGD